MRYTIQIAETAEKALGKIPKKDQEKIAEKIKSLELDPRPNGSAKLKGFSGVVMYRIRYGNYRIVYTVKDEKLLVLVVEIGNRKDIYR